jgi:hypothetical protein
VHGAMNSSGTLHATIRPPLSSTTMGFTSCDDNMAKMAMQVQNTFHELLTSLHTVASFLQSGVCTLPQRPCLAVRSDITSAFEQLHSLVCFYMLSKYPSRGIQLAGLSRTARDRHC